MNVISVDFKPQNVNLLMSAVNNLGWELKISEDVYHVTTDRGERITINNGKATGSSSAVNALRVAYSQSAVESAKQWAKAKGWQVQQTGPNKLTIKKGK